MNIKSCQDSVNWILTNRLLINDHNVIVINTKTSLIAGAFGINSTIWPINTKGIILINFDYLNQRQFTEKEIHFILAHEIAHIYKNHSLNTLMWDIIERLLKNVDYNTPVIVETFKGFLELLSPNNRPYNADDLKNNEYEADLIALNYVTGDLRNAISCLQKLSNGDPNSPSHTWELFNLDLPAMTLKQRIEVLKDRYYSFKTI
ncbi:MAG: M48 family metalloprotease [Nitrososphaeraceae archaeon]